MKKGFVILILLAFAAAGVFAQGISLSAGGGGLFDWSFNNGVESVVGKDTSYYGMRNMSFGGFLFFDATYGELDLNFSYGLITDVVDEPGNKKTSKGGSWMQAGVSILAKYPLDFGKFVFFPLLGASYNAVLISKDKDGKKDPDSIFDTIKDYSQIGFMGGAGFDYSINRFLYLRAEVLYQIRFAYKAMGDIVDSLATATPGADVYSTIGMSPLVKVGVAYKF